MDSADRERSDSMGGSQGKELSGTPMLSVKRSLAWNFCRSNWLSLRRYLRQNIRPLDLLISFMNLGKSRYLKFTKVRIVLKDESFSFVLKFIIKLLFHSSIILFNVLNVQIITSIN
jgi:hypothetical protein